jgi:subtilisin family serine protease
MILSQAGISVLTDFSTLDAVLADTSSFSGGLAAAQQAVLKLGKVRYADANFYVYPTAFTGVVPTDPLWPQQWGHNNGGQIPGTGTGRGKVDADIDAPEAWTIATGSSDVVVAVIDTGVWYNHPDLAANMWVNPGEIPGDLKDNDGNGVVDDVYGADFENDDGDPMDNHGHGTHVAGTVAAKGDNGLGVAGVSWDAKIMAVKFLGLAGGTTADAIEAINYVTAMKLQGVNIVASNNSWGGGAYSQALESAIQAQIDAGVVFVASAGNNSTDNDLVPSYPATYPLDGIISVASTDQADLRSTFSNYGALSVDLAAPGSQIISTMLTPVVAPPTAPMRSPTGYGLSDGTSMAAPHVSGAVAVIRGLDPTLTVQQSIDLIESGVDLLPSMAGMVQWQGRLNLYNSLCLMRSAQIQGTVWHDTSKNGTRQDYESGLAGFTVFVDLDRDGLQDRAEPSTTTAADGTYVLRNYSGAGTYQVRVVPQTGYSQTTPASGAPRTVTLATRESIVTDVDFGFLGTPGKVSGYKWNDVSGDGKWQKTTEKGLSGWVIYADLDHDERLDLGEPSTSTNTLGYYELKNLPSGTLWIREQQQPGYVQTYPVNPNYNVVTMAPAGYVQNVNFGNYQSSAYDYGDAPAPYPTLLADNGARAGVLADIHLGPAVAEGGVGIDAESDGFQDAADPTVDDNTTGVADEDGVVFTSDLAPGDSATLDVTVALGSNPAGMLQAWIDFNGNGSWADAGEQVFKDLTLTADSHTLTFNVPATAKPGSTWARFRYGYEKGLSFTGASYVGEVEDYRVDILSTVPIAVGDTATVIQDSVDNVIDVLANDVPSVAGRSRLLLTSVNTAGAAGSARIDRMGTADYTDDVILYSPASGVFAPDTFSYTITDTSTGATATATVLVTITQSQGDSPKAVDDSFTVSVATDLDVLANDRKGPTGTIDIPTTGGLDTTGLAGTATLITKTVIENGTSVVRQFVRYVPPPTPPTGWVDRFQYTIIDANSATDTATVTVHVPAVNSSDDLVRFRVEVTDTSYQPLPTSNLGQPEVNQGQQFRVSVYVTDLRGDGVHPDLPTGVTQAMQGVFSAYMDMLYDAGLVLYGGTDWSRPNPADPTDTLDDYDSAGKHVSSGVPGILDEIGSFQVAFTPLGPGEHFLYSAVFTAASEGLAKFATDPADVLPLHETTLNYQTPTSPEPPVGYENIEYDTASVSIVESPELVQISLDVCDTSGNALTTVAPGQEFLVRAWVDDIRTISTASQGLFSAYLDVIFPQQLVTPVADATNRLGFNITFGSLFGGAVGSTAHNGQTGDVSAAGIVNEVGAFQNATPSTFSGKVELCEIRFRALTPTGGTSTVVFQADPADDLPAHQVTVINPYPGQDVPPYQVQYVNSPTITIVGGSGESEYTNPGNSRDVNNDGYVSPLDVLTVVNFLNVNGAMDLAASSLAGGEGEATAKYYYDVNGDSKVSPLDVLAVINYLNAGGGASAEGEADAGAPLSAAIASGAATGGSSGLAVAAGVTNPAPLAEQTSAAATAVAASSANASGAVSGSHRFSAEADLDAILSDDFAQDVLAGWQGASGELV